MSAFIRGLLLALLFLDIVFSSRLHNRHSSLLKDSHEIPTEWSRVGSAGPGVLITLQNGLNLSPTQALSVGYLRFSAAALFVLRTSNKAFAHF